MAPWPRSSLGCKSADVADDAHRRPSSLGCKSTGDVADDAHRPSFGCKSSHDVADDVHRRSSVGCKSADVTDDTHRRPSLGCKFSDVNGSLTSAVAAAAKKKPTPAPDTDKSRRPFLAITELPDGHSPWPFLPMHELPEGHSSRRVVEIMFVGGWSGYYAAEVAAPPEVEAVFEVHATPRADAAFEEARKRAAARAARGGAAVHRRRCALDGNEIMRFQCRDVERAAGDVICASVETCRFFCPAGVVDSAVRTFEGSGAAHARVGGSGRRVMLVCRVIAGRVRRANDHPEITAAGDDGEYESVETGGGELVVLDSRAVLPLYLVVYKVKPRPLPIPEMSSASDEKKACTLEQLVEYTDASTYA